MKKVLLSVAFAASVCLGWAQLPNQETGVIVASGFHVTRPLTEIFAENPVDESKIRKEEE